VTHPFRHHAYGLPADLILRPVDPHSTLPGRHRTEPKRAG